MACTTSPQVPAGVGLGRRPGPTPLPELSVFMRLGARLAHERLFRK